MVIAGFLAVALADCVWIILFFSDARAFFLPVESPSFPPWSTFGNELSLSSEYELGNTESLLCLAVMIWLMARAVRRVARSISARPS
jgi:hypothetical protein